MALAFVQVARFRPITNYVSKHIIGKVILRAIDNLSF